jgi:hypothetical protein
MPEKCLMSTVYSMKYVSTVKFERYRRKGVLAYSDLSALNVIVIIISVLSEVSKEWFLNKHLTFRVYGETFFKV